jgi:hypothetical protein
MNAHRSVVVVLASLCALAGALVLCVAPALAAEGLGVTGVFGSAGSGDGQFDGPSGVAVSEVEVEGSKGDVYVVDKGNNRVERFGSTGVYLGQFNGVEIDGVAAGKTAPKALSEPEGVAVDNDLASPSAGDVYVVDQSGVVIDKFSATGEFLFQLKGFASPVFGVTVAPSGDVWVAEENKDVQELGNGVDNALIASLTPAFGRAPGIAVDSEENLYLPRASREVAKFNKSGATIEGEVAGCECTTGLAVDPSNNDLYVDRGSSVVQYGPFGEPYREPLHVSGAHGPADILAGDGIAVDGSSHDVYVADSAGNDVVVLAHGATAPAPKTDVAGSVRSGRARLNGDLNPEGAAGGVGFLFSYAEGSSCTGPGSMATAFDNGGSNATGSGVVDESTTISGLKAETSYAYCLVSENAFGPTYGPSETFTTASTEATFEPTVLSESVSGVTPFDAVLEARLSPENEVTSWHFEYSESAKVMGKTLEGATDVGSGILLGSLKEQPAGPVDIGGGLKRATTYYYRVVASNASGETAGPVQSFTTLAAKKPAIEAQSETAIGQTTVTLAGTVNPEYETASGCEFQYVSEETFLKEAGFGVAPSSVGCNALPSGGSGVDVTASVEGLAPNMTYYWRLVAKNGTGSGEGAPEHFLTLPDPPGVKTGAASAIGAYTATIAGEVQPGSEGANSETTYWFQYSTDMSYSQQIPLQPGNAGQGKPGVKIKESAELAGLEPDSTYHYRIVASNDNASSSGGAPQVVYGEGETFTTLATPPIFGETSVSGVTQSTVTITGSLNAQGLPTRYELRVGTESGALRFGASGHTSVAGVEALALEVRSLTPGTVYYYQLLATSPDGTVQSGEGSFTTPAGVPIETLPLQTFPQTPLLTALIPAGAFGPEEAGTITTTRKNPARCAKGKKLEHGKCVEAKAKRKGDKRKGKRG